MAERRPSRILALVTDGYGSGGGIAQFNRHLLDALSGIDDLSVRALGLFGARDSGEPPGLAWTAPARGGKGGFALAALGAALRRRPRLVISGHAGLGPLAAAIARLSAARLWSVTHGVEVWQPGPRLDNAALRRSDLVTTVSRYTRDRLLQWCEVPAGRVQVLHNTIDLERYRPGERPAELVRRYGVADKQVLLTVGRLSPHERYKGHDRVIGVLGWLNREVGPVHYVIAGSGADRERMEALVRSSGATPYVTFAGFVPDDQLQDHYRLADAFVMPSTGEGFGIVFLEALACGCPVVAGNGDGSTDALADGELGRLVDAESPEELRAAIADTLRAGRRHDARIAGVERFSLERFRARVEELTRAALG